VTGVAGVMALVLAEAIAGSSVFLWVSPLWDEVKRGFFKLLGVILAIVAALTWLSVDAALVDRFASADGLRTATLVAGGLTVLWTALLFLRQPAASRVVGLLSIPAWLAVLAFMGGATDGLLLGHWYLTDRRLTRESINRITVILLVSVPLAGVAVVTAGFSGVESGTAINPLLTVGALAPWIALGMVAATGLIAVLVKAALRGDRASAVQSATGFYYLAVVTAFTAEVAVKTRFLDPVFGPGG
jgi:hypothetical protein